MRILNCTFGRKRELAGMRFIILISCLFLLVISCNDNPVTPPEDQPGRRDYTWTVDTIPNYMIRMWGDSPTDVWIIGPAGNYNRTIYHYDGNRWTTDDVFRFISPSSIFGFSQNNVFIGGDNGKIWHFDGKWKEIAALTKDGHNDIVFDNMWGTTLNIFGSALSYDLYATGAYVDEKGYANNAVLAHYFNGNWEMINTNGLYGIVERLYKNKSDKKFYIYVNGGEENGLTALTCMNILPETMSFCIKMNGYKVYRPILV